MERKIKFQLRPGVLISILSLINNYCKAFHFNWNEQYSALKRCIKEGKWEEATARAMYLDDVVTFHPQYHCLLYTSPSPRD